MDSLVPLVVAVIGVIGLVVSYHLGKRATVDKNRIDRGFAIAEDIAVVFQQVNELENKLCTFFDMNFERLPFEDAWTSLETHRGVYTQQFDQVRELSVARERLNQRLKPARVYLRSSVVDNIQEYIDLSLFRYDTDGGVMTDTFEQEFLRNLVSVANRSRRAKLYGRIRKNLSRLVQ